jgi:FAD-linked sulfhydryl oxidase
MKLDPNIWGPNYWFFLHTIAINYPLRPTISEKKIFYNFIHNFHLFIPDTTFAQNFSKMLDDFPLTPYLDSRESFIRWIHFVHNKINTVYGTKTREYSLEQSMKLYYNNYEPKEDYEKKIRQTKKYCILCLVMFCISVIIVLLYNK